MDLVVDGALQVVMGSVVCRLIRMFTLLVHARSTGMDMISLEGKTNFFEKRVAEYQKSGVMASLEESANLGSKSLNFDAEF